MSKLLSFKGPGRGLPVVMAATVTLVAFPYLGDATEPSGGHGRGALQADAELVADLRSDGTAFNALRAYQQIFGRFWRSPMEASDPLVDALVGALDADDLQQRQMAASLLVTYYERAEIPDAQWPGSLIDALVEGLRDDRIRGGRQVANGSESLVALYGVRQQRPVAALEALLADGDMQARWGAAVLLAEYRAGSVQPDVSDELVRHLAADGLVLNQAAAFQSLRRLGEDNARDLLSRVEDPSISLDAQQAALLLCLGAWFDIFWEPPAAAPAGWLAQARARRSSVATAALFVYPDRDRILAGVQIPSPLDRMIRLGPPGRGLVAESHWAADWIWWLRTDDPYMGLPQIAAFSVAVSF